MAITDFISTRDVFVKGRIWKCTVGLRVETAQRTLQPPEPSHTHYLLCSSHNPVKVGCYYYTRVPDGETEVQQGGTPLCPADRELLI